MVQDEMQSDETPLVIHFVHSAATPHNNYLLDEVARCEGVKLHRHYMLSHMAVPGRPWKRMDGGEMQSEWVRVGIGSRFDATLFKLALFDCKSVFFVVGWDYPILVWLLILLGLRKRPLLMWDDGPSPESLAAFKANPWFPRQALKRLLIRLINRTDGVYFCTGRRVMGDVRQMGVRGDKLASLPFFVREGVYDERLRASHTGEEPRTLIVAGGRLIWEKGFDVFVMALARLKETLPDGWKAVLIGSGPESDRLHAIAEDGELDEHLDFVSWVESKTFASYVHSCDIFVAPARFDHFPTTVIAAMQAGVAVLATEGVGSAVEFIERGHSGEIVRAGDPHALAEAMRRLVENPASRARMASAGAASMGQWTVTRGARTIVEAAREAKRCVA